MNEDRVAYLDSVLIGGREPISIRIVEYAPDWPAHFDRLADRVRQALGERALSVQHIRSTSVPGLAAKPIIDMLLIVADLAPEEQYVPALETSGFILRVREPGHRMFRTPQRDAHLHVYAAGGSETSDYLDLRDWLRTNEPDRLLYAERKRELARQTWTDMNYYADAKTAIIAQILRRARAG
ncbi:GrpB family protein [Paenarthrobacter sp. PH39-S1]|uniref:GrpB family protein n=1 Tax=Paenarthrobacter sp. PH39-S1 TaxID=3046204 RepID=UPI0024B90F2C|nr:GrpB family protein [Paenarthrobacter sp. PH39-S1]MDJ0355416.1 GrpB family protein [Paenarthrobacter sp. PH39-S1]